MNKAELKQMLKPLIKECIKEVMFEDGVLSGVISEVARGLGGVQIVEARRPTAPRKSAPPKEDFAALREESRQQQRAQVDAQKKQLLDAIGKDAYNGVNLFEGTTPLTSAPTAPGAPPSAQGPMTGVAPHDSGVDISSLLGSVGGNWQAHLKADK